MESKDLANIILRAEQVAEYVRQIDSINYVMLNDEKDTFYIQTKKNDVLETPIVGLDHPLPEDIVKIISVERACEIMNKHLEMAKIEIIEHIKESIFQQEEKQENDSDWETVN